MAEVLLTVGEAGTEVVAEPLVAEEAVEGEGLTEGDSATEALKAPLEDILERTRDQADSRQVKAAFPVPAGRIRTIMRAEGMAEQAVAHTERQVTTGIIPRRL
jgi:hypothetical protein